MKNNTNLFKNRGTYNFDIIGNEDIEKLKPFIYGLIFPMAILLLTHSIIAMVSIQTIIFFIQNNINKNKKKAKETIRIFASINLIYGVLMLPFILSAS